MSERLPKKFLKRVIEEMILSEPSTVMKYTGGRCNPPCGKFEKRLRARLQQHALTKMLTLVAFLDLAKERHLRPAAGLAGGRADDRARARGDGLCAALRDGAGEIMAGGRPA